MLLGTSALLVIPASCAPMKAVDNEVLYNANALLLLARIRP
jgi:hypothetical protein